MRKALAFFLAASSLAAADSRPKVRAVTAFIKLDAAQLDTEIAATLKFLSFARDEYKDAGFEVETIRIVPQPLADYTRGMKPADALALLHRYDALAARFGFSANMGAIMVD